MSTGFSPGVISSCLVLLSLISRHSLTLAEIEASFQRIGVVPTSDAIEMAVHLRWLQSDAQGRATVTERGRRLIASGDHSKQMRQAILDYVEIEEPCWLQDAPFGRKRLLAFVGMPVAQVFLEADLTSGTAPDVVFFWDKLAARARGQKDSRLLAIGRTGERLTLIYEQERTGRRPRWVAIDNSADGYDVLSVVARDNNAHLTIEVKTTNVGKRGFLYLTRTEWRRAELSPNHVFHLWDLSRRQPQLAVVSTDRLAPHVPARQGVGEWELASIPFEAFGDFFTAFHCAYPPES